METLKRIVLIVFLLGFGNGVFSQPYRPDYIEFFDYTTIMNDLKKFGKNSKYYKDLDFKWMLYLDKASYKTLKKIAPNSFKNNRIDTTEIFHKVPESYVKEIAVGFNRIEEMFATTETWKKTILKLKNRNLSSMEHMELYNDVYVKDGKIAIITIYRGNWEIAYRVILTNKILRFEQLYEAI